MSDVTDPGTRSRWSRRWRERVGWRRHLPLLVALMLLWILLWEEVSWGNAVSGAVLAVVVTRLFYLRGGRALGCRQVDRCRLGGHAGPPREQVRRPIGGDLERLSGHRLGCRLTGVSHGDPSVSNIS